VVLNRNGKKDGNKRKRDEGELGDMVDILRFDDGFDIILQNLGKVILQLRPSIMPKNQCKIKMMIITIHP